MPTFLEWMSEFLNSKEPFVTEASREAAVEAFRQFQVLMDKGDLVSIEDLRKTAFQIDKYVMNAKPRHGYNLDRTLVLDPFFIELLSFISSLIFYDEGIHEFLRDHCNMLPSLTNLLNDSYQKEDLLKILMTLEVLTKGIIVTWSIPFLNFLIRRIYIILTEEGTHESVLLYAMRILCNLVFNNPNCLNMAHRDPKYKDVFKHSLSVLSKKDGNYELAMMALNFCLMTDPAVGISIDMAFQIENLTYTFAQVLQHSQWADFKNADSAASSIDYITMYINTILSGYVRKWQDDTTETADDQEAGSSSKSGWSQVKKLVEESLATCAQFFAKIIPMLSTDKGQVVVFALMNFIKALCPPGIPAEDYGSLWKLFAKSLREITMVAPKKPKVQMNILETHVHFLDRLLRSNKRNLLDVDSFDYLLKHCKIVVSTHPTDLVRNISTIRVLNKLNALASMQNQTVVAKILSKISKLYSEESLLKLLDELLSDHLNVQETHPPCLLLSTCIVELYNMIIRLSKKPTVLIEHLEKEKTWFHISNCIANGDEELINQAFTLLSSVGFSSKCRYGVSKTLMELRDTYSLSQSVPCSPEKAGFCPSMRAQMAISNLNHHLEVFQHNHVGVDPGVDEVLSMYKLKNDMYEMEITSLNDQIFHLNRTITHLKTLLNRQTELATRRVVANSTLQQEFRDLRKQLESTIKSKAETELKHIKATQNLRQQLQIQETELKLKSERVLSVEKQYRELNKSAEALQYAKDDAVAKSNELASEQRKLQTKLTESEKECKTAKNRLAILEIDYKKSEEARKAAESLLEAERRKTEIIQQVLGNRLN